MTGLGIIAGGGDLPLAIADDAVRAGRSVFLVALEGAAGSDVARFPHSWASIGQVGKTLSLLHDRQCTDVLLAGKVMRPKWNELKLDATGIRKLPRIVAAAAGGDDALLRTLVAILEEDGFRVVSAVEAAPGLLARAGAYGRKLPTLQEMADVSLGAKVVRALGALDVGQAAVVCEGLVLAVEAAEGTDAMVDRVSRLPESLRGTRLRRRGVLVKSRKPTQDGKTDLPVIGLNTLRIAGEAGLSGIAVEAGGALIVNRAAVIESADRAGLFLFGFSEAADA